MTKLIYTSFILLTIILYVANINGGYFSDDFTMFFPKGEINIFSLFYSINPHEPSVYRPLAGIYNGIVQYFFGTNAFLIHLMNILLHGIISCVIYNGIIRLNMNKQVAIIGSLFFIVAQSTATVTLRNCTMTQQLSCLFNLLFIYVLVFSEKPKIKRYLILCSLYVLGLCSKETGLATLPTAMALVFIMSRYHGSSFANGIKNTVFQTMPYIILTGAYFVLRIFMGLPFSSEGRATFSISLNLVKNLAMLIFSNINHFSSTDVFYALVSRNYTMLSIVVFVNVAFAAFVFYGVIKVKRVKIALVLILLMVISYFPTALMHHVSEVYGYNAMPFLCIMYAIGLDYWLNRSKNNKKSVCLAVLSVIILLNVASLERKAILLNNNANTAQNLIAQLQVILKGQPSGTQVFLINTEEDELRYSYGNFHMTAAETLQYADSRSFLYFLGRDDVSFSYRENYTATIPSGENIMLLTVAKGNLVPYVLHP